jgi:predicted ATP-dependent endonuclease of OLD family
VDGMDFRTFIERTDKQTGYIPLEEESKGFRWYFSFDLRFMRESNRKHKNCIILLDEPGIHLHPGAQADLLGRLKEYAQQNTVIYTTHMPFMVDLKEPQSIRVLEGLDDGAVVSNNLVTSNANDKMTLQNALGMKCFQSYLVGQKNLVVEGYDDFVLLTELSNVFERDGKAGLPEDLTITAAGGASEVVYMTTFMIGQNLKTVALFDSDKAGRDGEAKLRTKWLTAYNDADVHTLLLGDIVGDAPKEMAIEDMFPDAYYIDHFKNTHSKKIKEVGGKGPNVKADDVRILAKQIEDYCAEKGIGYNKGSVAKSIKKDLNKTMKTDDLPEGTYDKAKKLFDRINEIFG